MKLHRGVKAGTPCSLVRKDKPSSPQTSRTSPLAVRPRASLSRVSTTSSRRLKMPGTWSLDVRIRASWDSRGVVTPYFRNSRESSRRALSDLSRRILKLRRKGSCSVSRHRSPLPLANENSSKIPLRRLEWSRRWEPRAIRPRDHQRCPTPTNPSRRRRVSL